MGESYWALLHERLKGSGQSSISAIYVLIAKIFVILVLAIEAQQSWSGLKLVISIKSLASSGHLCLLRRVLYTAVGLTVIGKYQIFPFLGGVTGGGVDLCSEYEKGMLVRWMREKNEALKPTSFPQDL